MHSISEKVYFALDSDAVNYNNTFIDLTNTAPRASGLDQNAEYHLFAKSVMFFNMDIVTRLDMNGTSHSLFTMIGKTKILKCKIYPNMTYVAQLVSSAALLLVQNYDLEMSDTLVNSTFEPMGSNNYACNHRCSGLILDGQSPVYLKGVTLISKIQSHVDTNSINADSTASLAIGKFSGSSFIAEGLTLKSTYIRVNLMTSFVICRTLNPDAVISLTNTTVTSIDLKAYISPQVPIAGLFFADFGGAKLTINGFKCSLCTYDTDYKYFSFLVSHFSSSPVVELNSVNLQDTKGLQYYRCTFGFTTGTITLTEQNVTCPERTTITLKATV